MVDEHSAPCVTRVIPVRCLAGKRQHNRVDESNRRSDKKVALIEIASFHRSLMDQIRNHSLNTSLFGSEQPIRCHHPHVLFATAVQRSNERKLSEKSLLTPQKNSMCWSRTSAFRSNKRERLLPIDRCFTCSLVDPVLVHHSSAKMPVQHAVIDEQQSESDGLYASVGHSGSTAIRNSTVPHRTSVVDSVHAPYYSSVSSMIAPNEYGDTSEDPVLRFHSHPIPQSSQTDNLYARVKPRFERAPVSGRLSREPNAPFVHAQTSAPGCSFAGPESSTRFIVCTLISSRFVTLRRNTKLPGSDLSHTEFLTSNVRCNDNSFLATLKLWSSSFSCNTLSVSSCHAPETRGLRYCHVAQAYTAGRILSKDVPVAQPPLPERGYDQGEIGLVNRNRTFRTYFESDNLSGTVAEVAFTISRDVRMHRSFGRPAMVISCDLQTAFDSVSSRNPCQTAEVRYFSLRSVTVLSRESLVTTMVYVTPSSVNIKQQTESFIQNVVGLCVAKVAWTNPDSKPVKLFSCSTLSMPSCHATRRKHEGWDTARLPKPRQGKSRGRVAWQLGTERVLQLNGGRIITVPLYNTDPDCKINQQFVNHPYFCLHFSHLSGPSSTSSNQRNARIVLPATTQHNVMPFISPPPEPLPDGNNYGWESEHVWRLLIFKSLISERGRRKSTLYRLKTFWYSYTPKYTQVEIDTISDISN
ncbi:hypothetical protein CLF_107455 [Clonorchis sinensis]|uniref:Uncharacterized protein n=1 Tax=Clonorchis sinensis TaxID=79923 RepID=G7YGT9_CLOSI|nr:hypothetical protein CLF_107455 [Clonorchis sinensis]